MKEVELMLSVNTNAGALIALENLNNTSQQLAQAQNVVSTGLAIGSAEDNGAIWSIAQSERSTVRPWMRSNRPCRLASRSSTSPTPPARPCRTF
jgi:hypothetical protein